MQPMNNELRAVIEAVLTNSTAGRHQAIIYLDKKNNVVDRPPAIQSLFRSLRAFLVSNSDSGARAARRDFQVGVYFQGRSHGVTIHYTVECPPKKEALVAQALGSDASPQSRMEDLLATWVRAYLREHEEEALNEPESMGLLLERHLAACAAEATGLILTARVEFETPSWLRAWTLGPIHIPVKASDADLEVDLRLEGEISVAPGQGRLATEVGNRWEDSQTVLRSALAEYAQHNVTLHQLYAELNSTVLESFRSVLDDTLAPQGRTVSHLRLAGGPVVQNLKSSAQVSWANILVPVDHPDGVEVEAEALLTLSDLGAYVDQGAPSLQAWFEGVMPPLELLHLSDQRFVQLCEHRAAIASRISEGVTSRAREIGYACRCKVRFLGLQDPRTGPERLQYEAQRVFPGIRSPVVFALDSLVGISDVDAYAGAGSPEFATWIERELDQILTVSLHGVSYTDLCLEKEAIKEAIAVRMEQRAQVCGLSLEPQIQLGGLPLATPYAQLRHRVPIPLTGLGVPAYAVVETRLKLQNAEDFLRAQAPDLEPWFVAKVEAIAEHVLFDLTLTDVYRRPDAFREKVTPRLRDAASDLGYSAETTIDIHGLTLSIPGCLPHKYRLPLRLRSQDQHRGSVELVADALFELANAETFIDAGQPALISWFEQQVQEATDTELFGASYAELCLDQARLLAAVADQLTRAAEPIGYNLKLSMMLDGADAEGHGFHRIVYRIPIAVPGDSFPVELEAELLLELKDERRYTESEVRDVEAWVRKQVSTIADSVLFDRSRRELSVLKLDLEKEIRESLTEKAREIGYQAAGRVALDGLEADILKPLQLSEIFPCRVRGYGKPIQIKTDMILHLENLQLYLEQGAVGLKTWAQEQVRSIARDYLFKVDYTDLFIELDNHKERIEELVREAARNLGVAVKQLTTFTDLLVERLRKGLEIRIEDAFPTSLASVAVGLNLKAEIRIVELESIRPILEKHPELLEHIEAAVRRRLEQELRCMDPAEFYTAFQEPTAEGTLPVNQRIEKLMREVLVESFHAEVLDISCRQEETELSRLLEQLTQTQHAFKLYVRRLHGEPDLEFSGALLVEGIDGPRGWHTFRQRTPRPDALVKCAVEHLSPRLVDTPFELVMSSTNQALQAQLQDDLCRRVQNDLGLQVRIASWERKPMDIEVLWAKKRLAEWEEGLDESNEIKGLIANLRNQLYTAMASGLDDNRVAQLQARLQILQEEEKLQRKQHSVQPLTLGPGSTGRLSEPEAKALGTGDSESEAG